MCLFGGVIKLMKKVSEKRDLVQRRVLEGMGLIVLHSGHHSKIFLKLMGTNCNLMWREYGEKEVMDMQSWASDM